MTRYPSILLSITLLALAACGSGKQPVAGEVLGIVIHTQDAEELQFVMRQRLTDRYAAEKGIDFTDLDADFWHYDRDDSIYELFKPGSAQEAKAFADPPWLTD